MKKYQMLSVIPRRFTTGRGLRWSDGAPVYSAVVTILHPNDAVSSNRTTHDLVNGHYNAGSYHNNLIFGLFVDGSVRVIDQNIDKPNCRSHRALGQLESAEPIRRVGQAGDHRQW